MRNQYALYIAENIVEKENDNAQWYDKLEDAMTAARKAIELGETEEAEIMAFDEYGECVWDHCIEIDKDGAWSDDYNAREEMGFVQ